jgi:predicted N-formylglutamate amidohydrolase
VHTGEEILPSAFRVVNESGASPYVLVCEHASRFIPKSYRGLGLSDSDLSRHIAWDIGAENVALQVSQKLDASLILANYSRLLVDLNRPPGSETSIPHISEMTIIPGNMELTDAEKQNRIERYFDPFQIQLSRLLDKRQKMRKPTIVVGIHSFTPVYKGFARPWHAGILYRRSVVFGKALVEALGGAQANVVGNQPYQIDDKSDYTVPVHGEARGLDSVLVEIRQDLIAGDLGAANWAFRLGVAFDACDQLSEPGLLKLREP